MASLQRRRVRIFFSAKLAIMVDVDGTLAGVYRDGRRPLRPCAERALRELSECGPVFLWSTVGRENADRLLIEYPELAPYVTGTFGKSDFPIDRVEELYCIDDEEIDPAVLRGRYVIVDSYREGAESGLLLEAARLIVRWIQQC